MTSMKVRTKVRNITAKYKKLKQDFLIFFKDIKILNCNEKDKSNSHQGMNLSKKSQLYQNKSSWKIQINIKRPALNTLKVWGSNHIPGIPISLISKFLKESYFQISEPGRLVGPSQKSKARNVYGCIDHINLCTFYNQTFWGICLVSINPSVHRAILLISEENKNFDGTCLFSKTLFSLQHHLQEWSCDFHR